MNAMGCNSCKGFGAYFKDSVTRAGRAGRVVGTDRLGRAIATDGFGAYYLAVPGQMFSGFSGDFVFDANQVWSEWLAGQCGGSGQPTCTSAISAHAKNAVDSLRAALGKLGYGPLGLSVSWGSADQGAYKSWAANAGLSSSYGMPENAHLSVMQQQIAAGIVTGPNAPVDYSLVDGQVVQTAAVAKGSVQGMSAKTWALIALGGVALISVIVIAKKKKGSQYTSYRKSTSIEPYQGPAMVKATANRRRRHHRKHGR